MNTEYKSKNSVPQVLVALIATILVGSVALVGAVGPVNAASIQIAAQPQG
jgi:hypothetical protein